MYTSLKHIPEGVKHVGDGSAIVLLLGVWAGIVSGLASLATLIWMSIRIYETKTIQGILNKRGKKNED